MKLVILLAAVACSNCAKLDNTYLPPSSAQTSGGSGNFLQTPLSNPNEYERNAQPRGPARNFQDRQNYPQSSFRNQQNGFPQNRPTNNFQNQNGYQGQSAYQGQNPNTYSQGSNDFGRSDSGFAPNNNQFTGDGLVQDQNEYSHNAGNFGFNPESRPERAQAGFERNAAILRQDSQNDGETYSYAYETENGISAEESGVATNGVEAQGGFSYTGDDGQVYSVRYTADQNGFVPVGDHLPTPPPIPEEILRALEQNAQDEAAGIYDDGTYDEVKYGSSNNNDQYNGNGYQNGNNFANNDNYGNKNFGNNNADSNNYGNNNAGANFAPSTDDNEDSVVTNNALLGANQPAFRNQPNQFVNQNYRNQNQNQPGFNQGFRNNQAFNNGATTAYLPPTNQSSSNRGQSGPVFNQGGFRSNQGFGNQGNGASNAYLPPRSRQNGFGRRQPTSGRNGYQY